jgi:hypothetical protein
MPKFQVIHDKNCQSTRQITGKYDGKKVKVDPLKPGEKVIKEFYAPSWDSATVIADYINGFRKSPVAVMKELAKVYGYTVKKAEDE